MAFTQVLGLGLQALGMFGANKQANAAMEMQAQQLDAMRRQQGFQQYMGYQSLEDQRAENDYQRMIENLNRNIAGQERQWEIGQLGAYGAQLGEERQHEIDRQIEADKDAARVAEMQLQQYLKNEKITAEERKFAEQQLARAQAIAKGEREDDLRDYYERQARAREERDFVMQQFNESANATRQDRNRDLALRDRLTGQVGTMQTAISNAMAGLGAMPDAPTMTKEDLDAEISRRQDAYSADTERAMNLVASQNEANLVREGLDSSTPGTARRGDIASRVAHEFQSARDRAYDDALKYITGKQDTMLTGYNAQVGRRGNVLNEVLGEHMAGYEQLAGMPRVQGLDALVQNANMLPSVNSVTRNVGSAMYNPGISQSAVYNGNLPGSWMSNATVGSSAAVGPSAWNTVGSAAYSPYDQKLMDPVGWFNNADNTGRNLFNYADQGAADAVNYRDQAASNFGKSFMQFLNDSPIDQWAANKWPGTWGAGGTFGPAQPPLTQQQTNTIGGYNGYAPMSPLY